MNWQRFCVGLLLCGLATRALAQSRQLPALPNKTFPSKKVTEPSYKHYALSFDGNDDYVSLPRLTYDGTFALTVEAWVKPVSRTPAQREVICNGGGVGVVLKFYHGRCQFLVHDGEYRKATARATSISGDAIHIAGVYDGRGASLFINGHRQGNVTHMAGQHRASKMPFNIGANPQNKNRFIKPYSGVIDELRISSTARYDTTFVPPTRHEPDEFTVALYHFDEGAGSVAHDSSGNGFHGTIVGATWVADSTNGAPKVAGKGYRGPSYLRLYGTGGRHSSGHSSGHSSVMTDADLERRLGDAQAERAELQLIECDVTDAGFLHLKKLPKLSTLELNIRDCEKITSLSHLSQLPNLRALRLVNDGITDELLATLEGCPKLQSLSLYATNVTGTGLAKLGANDSLTDLEFSQCPFSAKGWETLATLTNLTSLQIKSNDLEDATLAHIVGGLNTLESLTLDCRKITGAGIEHVADPDRLTYLKIEGRVNDTALTHIGELKKLKFLHLMSGHITDAGFKHLVDLHNLTDLELHCGHVNGAGLRHLHGADRLEVLRSSCPLSDAGLALARIEKFPRLKRIWLAETQLTDASVIHLKSIKSLRELDFYDRRPFSKKGLDELRKHLHACKINIITPPSTVGDS